MCGVCLWYYVFNRQKSIEAKVENSVRIVKATCILHNVIIDMEGIDHDLYAENIQNNDREPQNIINLANSRQIALKARNKFKEYFMSSEGSV